MKINKQLFERTVYVILIANIFITLMISSFILSFRGSENNLLFSFENSPEFAVAVFLGFIIFYPLSFIVIYLAAFIIEIILNLLKKNGPAGN